MALYNPRCIIYKLLDIQKQKKEVLLKQAVQRISGKKNEEGKKKITETICVQNEKPVTKTYKEELEDK